MLCIQFRTFFSLITFGIKGVVFRFYDLLDLGPRKGLVTKVLWVEKKIVWAHPLLISCHRGKVIVTYLILSIESNL